MTPQGHIPSSASPSAHEGADLAMPLIVTVTGILGLLLVASLIAVLFFFRLMERAHPERTSEAAPHVSAGDLPPTPRLQTDPARDLQAVRAAEDVHLNGYHWIDREHGVAQIPVDRAMELWVRSYAAGATAAQTSAAAAPATTELQMRQEKAQEGAHAP